MIPHMKSRFVWNSAFQGWLRYVWNRRQQRFVYVQWKNGDYYTTKPLVGIRRILHL